MSNNNGDLISRSALLERIRYDAECFNKIIATGAQTSKAFAKRDKEILLSILPYLNVTPAVDAVEVVRCKDCKHRYQYEDWDRQSQEVVVCHECRVLRKDFGDDGFCSYGERRDGE